MSNQTNPPISERDYIHLCNDCEELKKENKALEDRVRILEIAYGRLSERMTVFQLAQASWTSIAAVISTIISTIIAR